MIYTLLILAAVGHGILWAAIVNRLHGLGIKRRWIDVATAFCGLMLAGIPLALAVVLWQHVRGFPVWGGDFGWTLARGYIVFCALHCLVSAVQRWRLAIHSERRGALVANHTTHLDLRQERGAQMFAPGIPTWLGRVPGNQVLDVHIHQKRLAIPRMSAGGGELRVVHISDFHMSGRIAKEYYRRTVEAVNQLEADLVAITGDLVERSACLDWLPDTLGRLRAAEGVYFVRGNHDRRVDNQRLLSILTDLGLVHLGSTWQQINVRDTPIVLAGNELPWFGTAPDLAAIPPRDENGLPLRIALAHGPDQFAWAQAHDFDLVLAGHNHGGQVRLPLVGAILAPSRSGTRYAAGAFRRGNTVLHVSRGTGSLTPFRWNCPPEIALLKLGSAS